MSEQGIDYGSEFPTLRRFYLKKRHMARQADELALSAVWHSRQEEQPGTALPEGFPYRAELVAAGYTTSEDLEGADADELVDWARLDNQAAKAVIAAYAAI